MANTAKVVSLSVRPFRATHLCFEVGGILAESNVELGSQVNAFDLSNFYALLLSRKTQPQDPARLIFDSVGIQAQVKQFALAALRAEPNKAALDKAVNTRANAFFAKYANAPDIIASMRSFYADTKEEFGDTKPDKLRELDNMSNDLAKRLSDEYFTDKRFLVKATQSVLDSKSDGTTTSDTGTNSDSTTTTKDADNTTTMTTTGHTGEATHQHTGETTLQHQTIVNTDYGYRMPFHECKIQFLRTTANLIDERFAAFMATQNLPHLEAVFSNELASIDSDVYQTQIAYLNTILLSPIKGTVTGVYKNIGEGVKPGDPVLRIENNDVIYAVATLVFRGRISLGSQVTVTTPLFDSPGPPATVNGSVVSARGMQEDDQWEVILKCNNLDGAGKPIFPLGYQFDYDNTTVSIA
jgi:hypothetical protein